MKKKIGTVAIIAMMTLAMAFCFSACDDIDTNNSNISAIADAAGIASIEKTNTEGLVDTYTVTFNDGSTCYFTVTNGLIGEDGEDGDPGIQGLRGEDGATPTITLNSEGYWIINGELSTIRAKGIKGETGAKGEDGLTPTITINEDGYWVINETVTTVLAHGAEGEDGATPTVTINAEGYWVINDVATEMVAQGADGADGKGIKEIKYVSATNGETFYRVVFTDNTTWDYKVKDGKAGKGISSITINDGKFVIAWTDGSANTEIAIPVAEKTAEEIKADNVNAVNVLFAGYVRTNYTAQNWETMRNLADDARYAAVTDADFDIEDVKGAFDAIDKMPV